VRLRRIASHSSAPVTRRTRANARFSDPNSAMTAAAWEKLVGLGNAAEVGERRHQRFEQRSVLLEAQLRGAVAGSGGAAPEAVGEELLPGRLVPEQVRTWDLRDMRLDPSAEEVRASKGSGPRGPTRTGTPKGGIRKDLRSLRLEGFERAAATC
jgi:hypothetical protein